jgi:DNA mismatch repair protein MutS2
MLETLESEVRQLRRRLRAAAEPVEAVSAVEERLAALEAQIPKAKPRRSPPPEVSEHLDAVRERPIDVGDTVWVRPLNSRGEVLKVDDGEAEVQVGRVRTQVSLAALEPREEEQAEPASTGVQVSAATPSSPGRSIDLRGQTVDETLKRLDSYLDQAMRAGLSQARIIHGKGTGALRRAGRESLTEQPQVNSYESADYREGGEGVTVANIVQR